VLDQSYTLARKLIEGPRQALAVTKDLLEREAAVDLREALKLEAAEQARCMQSADFKEGYQAFVEKRQPKFNQS
jgi:2-(1,2-epoxy-1,2-dihydrophenyl)acetyl-CoA isomerase